MFKMSIPKIFADFNNADKSGRVRLNTQGFYDNIQKMQLDLKEGMQVVIDDNDSLTTFGKLKYSEEENIWVAEIDWNNIHNY